VKKQNANNIVLDSAAVLAMIHGEPGGERVEALLDSVEQGMRVKIAMSVVNWCEVLTRMQRDSKEMTAEVLLAALAGVELVPFDLASAELAAGYARVNRALSLGDRACLALASANHATAWTADHLWSQCALDVPIELIRT
jgi:PIN domain nuclease of toxin-antitoxin system